MDFDIPLYRCEKLHARLSAGACKNMQYRAMKTYFKHFYEGLDLEDLDINDVAVMSACAECPRSVYRIPVDEVLEACAADLRQRIDAEYWDLEEPEIGGVSHGTAKSLTNNTWGHSVL